MPGDEIQIKDGVVYLNAKAVPKKKIKSITTDVQQDFRGIGTDIYEETLPNGVTYMVLDTEVRGAFDNVGPYKVPAGHYFVIGDNRDNSWDSRDMRDFGYVPFENFIGRAEIIVLSAKLDGPDAFKRTSPWTWLFGIRWSRFFTLVR